MSVRLDVKNYLYWSYIKTNFFKGRTSVKPMNIDKGYTTLIDIWEANKAKIIIWINNFVEHSIGT